MMLNLCSSDYKGQTFASLEESKNAQCQPGDSGQECALLAVYPENRVFSYTDARRYTATVQAKTLFNMTVDGAGNIRQCRTRMNRGEKYHAQIHCNGSLVLRVAWLC